MSRKRRAAIVVVVLGAAASMAWPGQATGATVVCGTRPKPNAEVARGVLDPPSSAATFTFRRSDRPQHKALTFKVSGCSLTTIGGVEVRIFPPTSGDGDQVPDEAITVTPIAKGEELILDMKVDPQKIPAGKYDTDGLVKLFGASVVTASVGLTASRSETDPWKPFWPTAIGVLVGLLIAAISTYAAHDKDHQGNPVGGVGAVLLNGWTLVAFGAAIGAGIVTYWKTYLDAVVWTSSGSNLLGLAWASGSSAVTAASAWLTVRALKSASKARRKVAQPE